MISRTEQRVLVAVQIVGAIGVISCTAYYVYWDGWRGLVYSVLAATLGGMIIHYFGTSLPVIGWLLTRGKDNP